MSEDVDVKAKLVEVLKRLDTVMVTTTADNGTMHGRPMAIAEVDPDGVVWFVTSRGSEKTDEVRADARALVTGQEKGLYLSLSGHLALVDDRERVRALWRESWKPWFPNGKEDPSIVLLRLQPEIGEYWDQTGTKGLRYLYEAAKAALDGKRVGKGDEDTHAKVPL